MVGRLTIEAPAINVEGFNKALIGAHVNASRRVAEALPEIMTDRIWRGLAPDKSRQKKNSPAWKAYKGNLPPLIHKKELIQDRNWDVRESSPGVFRIMVPEGRQDVARYLQKAGYTVYAIDDETVRELWDEFYEEELALIDFDDYVTTVRS
jgi:hypothetical protein